MLHPQRKADGSYGFTWAQMGAVIPAQRIDRATAAAPALTPAHLGAYAGDYALMPGFSLAVREHGGELQAQATGQGAFPLAATAVDTFEAPAYGIEIRFQRDGAGRVQSLELQQGGHVLRGARQ
ncbi:DUF3471 domain-containing protein [Pseudoxanthomonas sp. NC8]|nr:DUF3471 domain-containing protein [Pseudoxanthomonas sp. NC8]